MFLPLIFDLIALLGSLAALIILLSGWRRIPGREVKLFIASLLVFNSLYVFLLVMEWSGITRELDPYEDVIGALIPMWWVFVFYAFILNGRTLDLQKSEKEYRLLADNSIDSIWILDLDLNFTYINQAVERMMGFKPEEWIGSNLSDHSDPENLEIMKDAAARMLQAVPDTSGVTFEADMVAKDGSVVPLEISGKVILDEDGNPISLQGVARDIRDRRKAEKELLRERDFTRQVIDSLPGLFYALAGEQLVIWNQEFSTISGYSPEELSKLKGTDFFEGDDRTLIAERMQQVYREGSAMAEAEFVTKDGRKIPFVFSGKRCDFDGIPHLVGMGVDISDRKQIERERENLITKLEVQNAELERFTYTVSHDLKSPLITINGFIGMLRDDLGKGCSETIEHDLSRISSAADKMGRLLKELLDLSRIGRLVNPPVEVPLEELVHKALELAHGQIERRGVQVKILPELPTIYCDRVRLLEVMQNLIDNAVKYMGDQSEPRIEIGSRQDDGETVCFVRDNGIGIDPSYAEKVFGLFEQLDQKAEGSGIGLAVVKRIVEVHGGRIWVESDGIGHGSTFCFTLADRQ
ncbi:MAG: PAS domain S-box protein [Pirellulales bacterium]|nr:PAS domain S-box protein [Pirellulales bacterium]